MKQNTFDKKDGMLKKHSKKKFWKKVVAMLSCVTVFCTSYTMIMPAMTMSETTYCGQEEGENHTHTLQCYSNPNADLETEANWTATIPTLTGNWNEDVVAVANSQLGYQESTANYQVADNNEKKGYNRYGAWMNEPYADWNTDFVLFCLHYANVDTNSLSLSNDLSAWASNSAYVTKDSYTPKAGDLIILDENNDGSADHAAIITEANGSAIKIVEGDYSNAVGQENYDTTDARVIGYIQMPSNPAMPQPETPEETAAPVETSAPEETAQPEPTAAPEATEPAETAEPQETVEPEMTAAPEESSAEPAVPAAPSASKRMMPKIFRAPAANTTVDITRNLTNATIKIDGQDVTEGPWNVKVNKSYAITLHFEENSNSQFPDDDRWMTYPIPQGFIIDDMTKTFDMVINKNKFNEQTIHGNTMEVDKEHGLIKFKWNTEDINFPALQKSDDAYIDVDINGSFDSDTTEINFGGSVTRTVKVDSTHNASVSKTGRYDSNDGKIHYTVTVNSTGTSKDVVVTDDINGTALTYNKDVSYKSLKGATAEMKTKGNGFTATIPSMSDGEQVTFTYTASVDLDKLGQSGKVDQDKTSNGVNISCPGDKDEGDNSTTQFVNNISFSSLGKRAQEVGNTYIEDGKTYRNITWTINANEERKKHITHISDSINPDSQGIMTYSGDGLTIVVTKENGTQETRKVPWGDIQKTNTGWTYTPPKKDRNASYQVTYMTKADVTNLIDSRNVSNDAETNYSSATGSATVGPSEENQFGASKKATAVSSDKVTWEITVDVPASGLDKLVVTDTLPTQYVNNHNVYDLLDNKKGITVTGLDGSEDYSPDTSDPSKFVLTFYKDKNHKNAGMNSSNKKRTITISYTTTVSQEWVEYSGQHKEDKEYLMTHTNNATVSVPGIDKGIEAQVTITNSEQTIKKTGTTGGTYTDTHGSWQYYSYDIVLSGVTEDKLTLEDTFDTKHLRYFDGVWDPVNNPNNKQWDAGYIWGGNQSSGQYDGQQEVTVQETPTGIKINTGTLPRQNNGTFYSYYKIHYYLKAKLDDLQKLAAKEGGTATLRNSVKWGTQNATADVTYTYPGVDKKCSYDDKTKTASYTITINPSAVAMNKGQPMQLEDTFTYQMIDYSTIKISARDATGKDRSKEVTYFPKDGKLVFSIPDSTSICITYDAKPSGASGSVEMTNTAKLLSYHKTTNQRVQIDGSAGGGGTTTGLRPVKYGEKDMRVPLSGAVFQLLDADGNVLTYNTGDNNGKPITFTTGSDGYVEIQLSSSTGYTGGLQKGTKYFLREIVAPAGYQITEDIPFTISTDGKYDYSKNLYANGDTLLVPDKKITKVSITLKKVDSGNIEKSLQGAVFDLYRSDYVSENGSLNTNNVYRKSLTTGGNGTVELGTLESGTYYLVETTAPNGYGVISKPIKVVVTDEKVTVDQGSGIKNVAVSDVSGTKTAEITVADDKVYTLPATGGTGTTMIYVAGGVLVAVAVVMFVMQKRKRG